MRFFLYLFWSDSRPLYTWTNIRDDENLRALENHLNERIVGNRSPIFAVDGWAFQLRVGLHHGSWNWTMKDGFFFTVRFDGLTSIVMIIIEHPKKMFGLRKSSREDSGCISYVNLFKYRCLSEFKGLNFSIFIWSWQIVLFVRLLVLWGKEETIQYWLVEQQPLN